ncbi:MAG: hypothetical protein PHQ04_10465 [Opitutaceae bacterium]|nr:hypothetical protein [Opitutaceae bacterium]
MSLINDALRKAQRQRTGENVPPPTPPATGTASAEPLVRRRKPLPFVLLYMRLAIGAGVMVLILIVGLTIWWFGMRSPAIARSPAGASVAVLTPKQIPSSRSENDAGIAPSPQPEPQSSTAATVAVLPKDPMTQTTAARPATPIETPPSGSAGIVIATTSEVPPVAPTKPDARILALIENIRVTGIRSAGTDSKVLMNDRVYRVNDFVDHQLGVKLSAVEPNTLVFVDENGVVYRKDF